MKLRIFQQVVILTMILKHQAPQPILSSADLLSELDETAEEEHEI